MEQKYNEAHQRRLMAAKIYLDKGTFRSIGEAMNISPARARELVHKEARGYYFHKDELHKKLYETLFGVSVD